MSRYEGTGTVAPFSSKITSAIVIMKDKILECESEELRTMLIGERLKQLREQKGFSQGDVEKASGLLRCYISRVEHGHTVPSLETMERFAAALDIPLYRLFYAGEDAPPTPNLTLRKTLEELAEDPGTTGSEARFLVKLKGLVGKLVESDRVFLLDFARKLAARS
jgi:transcriptional regulator with XRE-family HTH domain